VVNSQNHLDPLQTMTKRQVEYAQQVAKKAKAPFSEVNFLKKF
jgi:predicted transcriptional regulator